MKSELVALREAQKQRIERIVCSGGGAKGVVYAGAYRAMVDSGVFNGVQQLSGASAGAITASLMAVGMPTTLFRDRLLNTNLKQLMGERVRNPTEGSVKFITKDGKPLETFIRENIIDTLKGELEKQSYEKSSDFEFQALRSRILEEEQPKITFADLAVLHRAFPQQFKQLTIPAVRFPGGELQIFNNQLTPEVEIAKACRASASIPIVLEPVEIEINGEKQRFVDGGLFDNLPTDYFDFDEQKGFSKNKKAQQTLVFSFGEGLDDKKNQTHQALYGQRLDEIISNEVVETMIHDVIRLATIQDTDDWMTAEEEASLLKDTLRYVLQDYNKNKIITDDESKMILAAMKQSMDDLLLKPQKNQKFWEAFNQKRSHEDKFQLLCTVVKEKMKPILYKAGFLERLKRNYLVKKLGGLSTPYRNTDQKEAGYQKLRSQYPLRTVELRVGEIKTTDFSKATKLARVMDSIGYLDTINHITNHNLHNPSQFNESEFFNKLVNHFEHIHRAVLIASGKKPENDNVTKNLNRLRAQLQDEGQPESVINQQLYQVIKEHAEKEIKSTQAFALSRAVEYQNKTLSSEALFKEVYEEGFRRSGFFSQSNITGERIFNTRSLQRSLSDKNMFELYKNQEKREEETRTDKVFKALSGLNDFSQTESVDMAKSYASDYSGAVGVCV